MVALELKFKAEYRIIIDDTTSKNPRELYGVVRKGYIVNECVNEYVRVCICKYKRW